MDAPAPPPRLDPSDVRFWRRNLLLGCGLSVAVCAVLALFTAATWDRPDRAELAILIGVVSSLTLTLPLLPVERLLRAGLRDVFLVAWSAAIVGVITLAVAIDGERSSLVGLFFLPLIFATMAYPLAPMIAVGAMVVGAFLATTLPGGNAADALLYAACLATAAVMCARQTRLHGRQRSELARLSRADPLTGCLNRRGFQERLDAELARATRAAGPVALVLIDLDRFKAVNDVHGHAVGDELLCWTVRRIGEAIRPADALGRIGGDEFAVLLAEADAAEARDVAIRIEAILSERTAASTGTATFPEDGIVGDELHLAADRRLYEAKGRPHRRREPLGR